MKPQLQNSDWCCHDLTLADNSAATLPPPVMGLGEGMRKVKVKNFVVWNKDSLIAKTKAAHTKQNKEFICYFPWVGRCSAIQWTGRKLILSQPDPAQVWIFVLTMVQNRVCEGLFWALQETKNMKWKCFLVLFNKLILFFWASVSPLLWGCDHNIYF